MEVSLETGLERGGAGGLHGDWFREGSWRSPWRLVYCGSPGQVHAKHALSVPKKCIFSSDPRMCFHFSTGFSSCSLAQFNLAVLCRRAIKCFFLDGHCTLIIYSIYIHIV